MKVENQSLIRPWIPRESLDRIRRMDVLIALAASSILTSIAFFWLFPLVEHNPVAIYRSMAVSPFHFYAKPYGARLLTPLIAHFLPLDPDTALRVVAFLSFVLSGTLLFLLFRLLDVNPWLAAALLPGFYFAPTAKFIIANSWFVDPMNYWLLVLVFIGIFTANTGVTAAALTLSAFNRPESMAVLPLVFIAWWRRDYPVRSLKPILIGTLPALGMGLALMFLWPVLSDLSVMVQIGGIDAAHSNNLSAIFKKHGFKVLISSQIYCEIVPYFWGLAAIGFLRVSPRIKILCLTHIVLSVLPMLVAIDFFRLPFYAFPAVLLLAGVGIVTLSKIHPALAIAAVLITWPFIAFAPQSVWLGTILTTALLGIYLFLSKKSQYKEIQPQQ